MRSHPSDVVQFWKFIHESPLLQEFKTGHSTSTLSTVMLMSAVAFTAGCPESVNKLLANCIR